MRLTWLVSIPLLLGCSDRDLGGDGSSSDTEGSAGSTSGETGGGTSSGGGSGGGSGDVCGDYLNDTELVGTTIVIRNDRDVDILLGGPTLCQPESFKIESQANDGQWSGPHCALTCEDAINGACGCTADCPGAPLIRVIPGGSYTAEWAGMLLVPTDLPAACSSQECGTSCSIGRAAATGTYDFTVVLVTDSNCDGGGCTCEPNLDGWCMVAGWPDTPGETFTVAADLPADLVTVAVE